MPLKSLSGGQWIAIFAAALVVYGPAVALGPMMAWRCKISPSLFIASFGGPALLKVDKV